MTPDEFLKYLDSKEILYGLHHHPAVFSVAESEKIDAQIPGTHTRNLFLKDKKDRMFLVTLRSDIKIDLKKLGDVLGAGRLSFGSPERLQKYLGVTPGSVTPFSVINDQANEVTLILEEQMMQAELVNYHPLINTMTVGLTPSALQNFLQGIGHNFRILDLSPTYADSP